LQSLDANLDATQIEDLLSQREEGGFDDYVQTFSTLVTNPAIFAQLTESSSFFQLKAVVQIGTVRVTYYSVLSRSPNGGPVTTILRSLGTI
jgi:hypothetical protein